MLLGVDTGGTFTDFVFYTGGRLRVHKVLSTPAAPEQAILRGIREMGLAGARLRVIHGSTVATNAVLEGKGARTVLITNAGLADLLAIGRQAREALYDLQPLGRPPPVPAELCLEAPGRLSAQGDELEGQTDAALGALRERIAGLAPEAVAIVQLFAYRDDRHERAIEALVPEGVFVSRSSRVLPEYREYERGVATWINARLGPVVQGYLERLVGDLGPARVAVMQSSGESIRADQAADQAVRMLLSGPAGGLAGAGFVAAQAGHSRVLSFDMGGTSTDVALVEGEPRLTSEGRIGGFPVAVPMVDMHTIGAGGGSLARVDAGGLLRVGPESAGAEPGPACYGQGGTEATVTDANLVLGRLVPEHFLGGAMTLDVEAAWAALARLGEVLGGSPEEAARGVVRVANEHMARALRVISVQRGVDPRGMALVSFGGAGGLHACALAEALDMRTVLVPVQAGVLSALGMLVAPPGRRLSRTLGSPIDGLDPGRVEGAFRDLEGRGREALLAEGVAAGLTVRRAVDLRYAGQSYTLGLPWSGLASASSDFHSAHARRYGHRLEMPVELVNLRVALRAAPSTLVLPELAATAEPAERVQVHGQGPAVPVWRREALGAGQRLRGPALIAETVATTWLAPAWSGVVDRLGNLVLAR